MALGATIYSFEISLADADRNVYETLSLRVARHPSETEEYLITRLLAYCMEYREGIAFSKGLSDPEEPAIAIRDLTGALQTWIDIGAPEASRMHKASKAAPRVAIYTHKDVNALLAKLSSERIHRAAALEIYSIDKDLLAGLVAKLDRRMTFSLSIADKHLYVSLSSDTMVGMCVPHRLDSA